MQQSRGGSRLFAIALVFGFVLGGNAFAGGGQDPSPAPGGQQAPTARDTRSPSRAWEFVVIPFNEEMVKATINLFVENDYQPAALEFDGEGSLYAIFSKVPLQQKVWALVDFSPLSRVNSEFGAWLQEGWMPLDITLSRDHFMTIFAKTELKFTSMRVVSLEITDPQTVVSDVRKIVDAQADEGRILYGLTAENGDIQLMFLASDALLVTPRFEFRIYPNDGESLFAGLEQAANQKGIPVGLAVTKDWLYTGFYYQ